MKALGFMSGTSLDGVDAALIETDGLKIKGFGPGITVPYPETLRQQIKQILGHRQRDEKIRFIEQALTDFHADVFRQLNIQPDVIGFHGQTITHAPPFTWQLGDGQRLAQMTNCPVVFDFRSHDVAAGGQGAPLVPVFHQALFAHETEPVAVINIGGVANLTYIDDQTLLGFDTGPGIALLDQWVQDKMGQPFDSDGALTASGIANLSLVTQWLEHPYFQKTYPKSLDRESFAFVHQDIQSYSAADGAATLAAFTLKSIEKAFDLCPQRPSKIYLCGGGRHNHVIQRYLPNASLIDDLGFDGDLLEAQAFAFMAVRHLQGLPLSFPLTTGVSAPMTGGLLATPPKSPKISS